MSQQKVMVIGLDGATWSVLRPRMESGLMPNLRAIVEQGAHGNLRSIFPPETPAAWPSFMTGKNPGKHGVFDFLVYDPEMKTHHPVSARRRHGKTLWEYLSEAGKTCLVLNVPTTYPVIPIKGAMISDFLTPGDARDYTHPPELAEELEKKYGRYPLWFEHMQFVVAHSPKNADKYLTELEQADRIKFETCADLFDRYQPDFTVLHIWGTDRLQHEVWHWFDKTHPAYDEKMAKQFGPRIEAYWKMIDDHIGRLAAKVGDDGIVFVISDHGFGPTHYFIDLNSWLLREGFIVLKQSLRVKLKYTLWRLGFTPHNLTRVLNPLFRFAMLIRAKAPFDYLRKISGTIDLPGFLGFDDIDWTKTKAYAPYGWSGIFINTVGIRPNGSVPPEEYDAVRDAIVARLKELRNPYTGEKVPGPIYTKQEMYHGPFTPYAPDIMPLPLDHCYMPVCFFGFASHSPVYRNITLYGNHIMDGILMVRGKGIRRTQVSGAQLIDIAPTVLYLLGHPVPTDMDGKVLTDLIEPHRLQESPIRYMEPSDAAGTSAPALTAEEEAELEKRLIGLGYL